MQEIEVKILEVDKAAIQAKLEELGAEKHFEGELHALFFDDKDNAITARGDVLRIRKEGDEVVLAYKSYLGKGEAKIMEELETNVSDLEMTRKIFEGIGLATRQETRKTRTEYLLAGTKVVIDEYKDRLAYIPTFIEVEAPDLESMYQAVEMLGYSKADCKDWNTYDLMIHYAKEGDAQLK